MGMMDLYSKEQAIEALEEVEGRKKLFVEEIQSLDTMIFILKYYLVTGDGLKPEAFGFEDPEEGDFDE